jgi:hypothetical protein
MMEKEVAEDEGEELARDMLDMQGKVPLQKAGSCVLSSPGNLASIEEVM